MILQQFPPMGIYEILFKFADATNKYMGDPDTHPWAQGYPLTRQLPGGPSLPSSIDLVETDLKYPKATGEIELRQAISDYYNRFYQANISPDNVAVFAGGRPAILAILAFLEKEISILIEETEYTPYFDMLRLLTKEVFLIPSNESNQFRPGPAEHKATLAKAGGQTMLVKSNPCNPTGVLQRGERLRELVRSNNVPGRSVLFDEAYEFFCDKEPVSALQYVDNIDDSNVFVVGAATKGLQVPGMRIGWAIAAQKHIEIFRNYSSFGMGGVSRASQLYVCKLLEAKRVEQARNAVGNFYGSQRKRYGQGLADLGFELHTGDGGFYHWGKLPNGLTAEEFNERLFRHKAGVLPGRLCDMNRTEGEPSVLDHFVRFSFGPLEGDSFEEDMSILADCV